MRHSIFIAVASATWCGLVALDKAAAAECVIPPNKLPGVTIPGDISSRLALAGFWAWTGVAVPGGAPSPNIIPFFATGKLGLANADSVVAGGWIIPSAIPPAQPYPSTAAVFSEDGAGLMHSQPASAFGGSLTTQGPGSVLIADFNGDGVNDIFFPAHNEAPMVPRSSTAFVSSNGGYRKITVGDMVEDHGSSVFYDKAKAYVLGANFYLVDHGFPVYSWDANAGTFSVAYTPSISGPGINGESIAAADFNNDGHLEAVLGFNSSGPGLSYDPNRESVNLYSFDSLRTGNYIKTLSAGYFDGKAQFAGCPSQWDPKKSEQYFARAIDLKGNGWPDVAVGEQIWSGTARETASKIQVFINHRGLNLVDETDSLMSEMPLNAFAVHTPTFDDFDGSGALSLFLGSWQFDLKIESDVLLLNDGTGKFHLYLLKQFDAWASKIAAYVINYVKASYGYYYYGGASTPTLGLSFQPYFTSAHKINFLSFVGVTKRVGNDWSPQLMAISVPAAADPNVDFTRDVTVTVDPLSPAAHGWAGNDVFIMQTGTHRVDGGLGVNTAVFSGARNQYSVVPQSDGSRLVTNIVTRKESDRLARVQKLQFADKVLTLIDPPVVVANPIADQSWTIRRNLDVQLSNVTFASRDSLPLTFSARQSNGSALPSWLTFDGSTGRFAGTVPSESAPLKITVKASDPEGHSVSSSFSVNFRST